MYVHVKHAHRNSVAVTNDMTIDLKSAYQLQCGKLLQALMMIVDLYIERRKNVWSDNYREW